MTVDTHAAAVHFRIEMCGQALERSITELNAMHLGRGRIEVQNAIGDLQHAIDYLTAAGTFPQLLSYIQDLKSFYTGQLQTLGFRPQQGPAVGAAIYNNQSHLLNADPVLFPAVAH